MFRLLVTGSDRWPCDQLAREVLSGLLAQRPDAVVVHDGTPGVAGSFRRAAFDLDVPTITHGVERRPGQSRAQFEEAQAAASEAMVSWGADVCLVLDPVLPPHRRPFSVARRAVEAGIPTWWIADTDACPVRLVESDGLKPPPKPHFDWSWHS